MSKLTVKDANGVNVFLRTTGTGTDVDPFVAVQDVYVQDQFTPQISLFLGQILNDLVTLRSNQAENAEILNVNSSVAPVVGNHICLKEGSFFTQSEISTVTSLGSNNYDLGVSMPLDHAYTTASVVCLQNCNLNVNGSVTPVSFAFGPFGLAAGEQWDITRMLVSLTHSGVGDDGLFGDEAKLANGVYFRIEDGTNYNLFNARENGDFAIEGYDITYPTRSGAGGVYGTRARISFAGQSKRGVVIRLASDTDDKIVAVVRDDLSGLSSFRVKFQGHVVS